MSETRDPAAPTPAEIRAYREARGLSRAQQALRWRTPLRTLEKWEQDRNPAPGLLRVVMDAGL